MIAAALRAFHFNGTRGIGEAEHLQERRTVSRIALETVSAVGSVWKKFGKVKTEVRLGSIARQDLQACPGTTPCEHNPNSACFRFAGI